MTADQPHLAQRELAISIALVILPLLAGLLVNAAAGWWAGLAALAITGAVVGVVAFRADRTERAPVRHRG